MATPKEKALHLLSGVVIVGGVQWVMRSNHTNLHDCKMCPHGGESNNDCGEFLREVRGSYLPRGACDEGFIWIQLKPEPSSS